VERGSALADRGWGARRAVLYGATRTTVNRRASGCCAAVQDRPASGAWGGWSVGRCCRLGRSDTVLYGATRTTVNRCATGCCAAEDRPASGAWGGGRRRGAASHATVMAQNRLAAPVRGDILPRADGHHAGGVGAHGRAPGVVGDLQPRARHHGGPRIFMPDLAAPLCMVLYQAVGARRDQSTQTDNPHVASPVRVGDLPPAGAAPWGFYDPLDRSGRAPTIYSHRRRGAASH